MSIQAGQPIVASDFVATSAGAGDSGKVPKLGASGELSATALPTPTTIVRTYNGGSSGNWSKPAKLKYIDVEMWAGGGGGGIASGTGGSSGGGGGGWNKKRFMASELGSTEAYSVGAGGASKAINVSGTGNNGGNSTFGTAGALLLCYGGQAGGDGAIGGTAGRPTLGSGKYNGISGDGGLNSTTADNNWGGAGFYGGGGGGSGASTGQAGGGGAGGMGGGGGGSQRQGGYGAGGISFGGGAGGSGGNGAVPAGGGSASKVSASVVSFAGGDGKIIITEYY